MRAYMHSDLKQKKVITIHLNRIDLNNISEGEMVEARVKANFETEVPYEVVVMLDGEETKDFR